jgi:NADPH2:quinone reductase
MELRSTRHNGTAVVTGVLSKAWGMDGFTPALISPTRKKDVLEVRHVLQEVINKVRASTFKKEVFLDYVFQLEEVGKAHEYMEDNRAVGKVVLEIP